MADLQSTNSDYNRLGAEELVGLFLQKHRKACITCSFQAEGMVVLDFARKIEPDIPVLFLETGYHFPETYAYRDRMAAEWRLNLVNLVADSSVAEQEAAHRKLYQTAPDRCCHLRKVEPLLRGLHPYDTWFTGRGASNLPRGQISQLSSSTRCREERRSQKSVHSHSGAGSRSGITSVNGRYLYYLSMSWATPASAASLVQVCP